MYKHLISTQRSQIFAYKQCGKPPDFITKAIGVHRSTVYRELARNSNKHSGYSRNAQEIANERNEHICGNSTIPAKLKFERLQHIRVDQW